MKMGAKDGIMTDKLPDITKNNKGFHGFSSQLHIEDVSIEFHDDRDDKLPKLHNGGVISNQQTPSRKTSRQKTFLTCDEYEDDQLEDVGEAVRILGDDDKFCSFCAEKAAQEAGKLTAKIMELKLENERHKVQYESTKRKLDNTSKELKTAQAMIETLKCQNTEKANRIANLAREATIGLWNREKKKLLQFADVREASLEYELESLKGTSQDFKFRALDRIQFLHEQVYKLKLRLNIQQGGSGGMNKMLEAAEKKLKTTREEFEEQKKQFFQFRRNIVGMLAGFRKDFNFLTNQVDESTYEQNADFFDAAEKFDSLLDELHKSALNDNLSGAIEKLPARFMLADSTFIMNRYEKKKSRESELAGLEELPQEDTDSMTDEEMLKKLENIEKALEQSSKELTDFDSNLPEVDIMDINDSGISLNDYGSTGTVGTDKNTDKIVRFEDANTDEESNWKKRRRGSKHTANAMKMNSDKAVQVDFSSEDRSPLSSRRGKRGKKSKSRSATPTGKKKRIPKKIEGSLRMQQEKDIQKEWLNRKLNNDSMSDKKHKNGTHKDGEKNRQNTNMSFTRLRELYGEKRDSNLIDRSSGVVNIDVAASQFPNLSKPDILEGFTHFVQYDSNNDYRLDMMEMVRAISRATDVVIEPQEIKLALYELGVLETDELDFFDFLCIQETLTTGTFDKSKSKMLRMQGFTPDMKGPVSKYCTLM